MQLDSKNNVKDNLLIQNTKTSSNKFKFKNKSQNIENDYETVPTIKEIQNNELDLDQEDLIQNKQPKVIIDQLVTNLNIESEKNINNILSSSSGKDTDKDEKLISNDSDSCKIQRRRLFIVPVPKKSKFYFESKGLKNKFKEEISFKDPSFADDYKL